MGQLASLVGGTGTSAPPPEAPAPAPAAPIPGGLAPALTNYQPATAGAGQTGGGLGGYLLPARSGQYLPAIGAGAPQVGYGTWVPPRTAVPGMSPTSQVPGTSWRKAQPTSFVGGGMSTPTPGSATGQSGSSNALSQQVLDAIRQSNSTYSTQPSAVDLALQYMGRF